MKINGGDKIRKLRKENGCSQEEMASKLFISVRQLSRIETGEIDMDIWQFMSFMELLGHQTEDFWLLYLESNEYEDYRLHKRLKRLIRDGHMTEAKDVLEELKERGLSKRPLVGQFIAYAEIAINWRPYGDALISAEQALEGLDRAISMSIKSFDESKVADYFLTYNEILIITEMAIWLEIAGEIDRSILLTKAIMDSRENTCTSEEDRALIFPALMSNLSTMLGKAGRFKEALKICNQAIEFCREYNNLLTVPKLLYNIASCYHAMGEEEQIYKPYLIRAYHCAYAMGDNEAASIIKSGAVTRFGTTVA